MDRIHRAGLITLAILLLIAAGGFMVDRVSNQAEIATSLENAVVLDAGGLLAIEGLPPQQRRMFPRARDFQARPSSHPMREGSGQGVAVPSAMRTADAAAVAPSTLMATEINLGEPSSRRQQIEARANHAPTDRIYRVREGDVLSRIALRELDDRNAWRQIAALNGITDEGRSLQVGDALILPPKAGESSAPQVAPAQGTLPAPQVSSNTPAAMPSTYTVVSGDTPDRISKKLYGSSKHWERLLAANGLDDPRALQVGAVLKVPPLP
ncbi:MAG: LysM peptidoglycan-binding domain-containing protein [Planctomycetes bacterium]|nr:LysM peptidoglycan-binding domain-containing protein [Planctomycetota bacterium]MBT4028356.1 LysM peptidoglycan-binding domain-containing protein [Planctomycetota bacterium]MBT4561044.1 LysM peptidoglycan-binding domain-containing protein [Planctomycetota bacterium]MBT7011798.1 LysM peptidoglycan-binding domain-containing protein [Planctomycetota bacterium]MBT7319409.1 LysM peptidoglycan-binding domain-containing protein [Planctomycetota bacterium]